MNCIYCGGRKHLTPKGVVLLYLKPHWLTALLLLISLGCAVFYSGYFYFLSLLILAVPLANADFRLYLFPFVFIGTLCGLRPKCPRC